MLCFQQGMLSFDVHQNLLGNFLKVQRSRPYQISKSWRLYILLEHKGTKEISPILITTVDPEQSSSSRFCFCSCNCVLCSQTGSVIMSASCLVVAPRRFNLPEHQTEKGKPHQGENKAHVWLSPKLGFQWANKTHSAIPGLWDTKIQCKKKKCWHFHP